jgi:hypothetical protein
MAAGSHGGDEVSRRATYLPSRRETARWILVRVCAIEALLIVGLVLDLTMHPFGIR